jgi:hypothetical protein
MYPSLRDAPARAERLARLLTDARRRGIRPLTSDDFDRLLDGPSDWPAEENLDDFLAWLRRVRHEG